MGSASLTQQLGAGTRETFEGLPRPPLFEQDLAPSVVAKAVSDYDRRYRLSLTSYVHGEMKFSIYPEPQPKKRRQFQGVARAGAMEPDWMTPEGVLERRWSDKRVEEARLQRRAQPGSLDSSSEFQDRSKGISGWGELPRQKTFRAYGRQMIQEAGEIAWRKFQQSGIFLTGTIPGSGAVIAQTVAMYSGWLLNRVKQWFRDGFSQDYSVFAVWELQKRGMLHIHLCVCSMEKPVLNTFLKEWKQRWNSLLLELSALSNCDVFRKNSSWTWQCSLDQTQQDAQWLSKNPSRYLSKYLSKGSRLAGTQSEFHPSRWWSVDRKTAAEARAARMRAILAGASVSELLAVVKTWFEAAQGTAERVFEFKHPEVPDCGGIVAFFDATIRGDMFEWFYEHARENFAPDLLISC